MALALRSISFINQKETRIFKSCNEVSAKVYFQKMKPSFLLKTKSSMKEEANLSQAQKTNNFYEVNTQEKWEKIHAPSIADNSQEDSSRVPLFVMLPLDTVTMGGGNLNKAKAMNASLMALKSAGVEGVMVDAWWGLVEKAGPLNYNWDGYAELIQMVQKHGLKLQVVMSFHQCGGNVGDSCRYIWQNIYNTLFQVFRVFKTELTEWFK